MLLNMRNIFSGLYVEILNASPTVKPFINTAIFSETFIVSAEAFTDKIYSNYFRFLAGVSCVFRDSYIPRLSAT